MESFEEQGLDDFSPVVVKYARTLYDNSSKYSYDGLVKRLNRRRWSYKPARDGCVSDCVQEYISTEIDLLEDCESFLNALLLTIRNSMDQELEMEDGHAVRDRTASVRLAQKKMKLVEFIIDNDILMDMKESSMYTEEFLESRLKNRYGFTWAFDKLLQVYPQWKPRVCPYDRPNSEEQEFLDAIEEASRDYYDSQEPSTLPTGKEKWNEYPPQAWWWCPVTKCFWPGSYHKTAQIVPAILGGRLAGYMFDFPAEDADTMVFQNPRNTLPMAEMPERMFDKHQVTVMPEPTGDFRFLVLDKSILSQGMCIFRLRTQPNVQLGTFHNTTLEWKNEARPSRDFLLWHFLMSLLRWRDLDASAWEADREGNMLANNIKVMYSQIWSAPAGEGEEGCIRKELISAFARREGFADLPQEFYNWLSPKPSLCLYRAMSGLFVSDTDDADMVAAEAAVVASELLVEQRTAYRRAADWKHIDPY